MAISAAELNVILSARDKEFQRKMKDAERRVDRFKKRSTTGLSSVTKSFGALSKAAAAFLPALSAGAIISKTRQVVASLDDIGKTADRLGLTTDALQELRAAAEQSGVSVNTFDMAMQRFGRRLAEARQGTGAAQKAFEEMGISLVDAGGRARSMEDVLGDVANAMSQMTNQTDRNRLAMRLFDSEGVALVNMLRDGADGLEEMRARARELGIVIDEELIRNAETAQTELDLMARVIDANLSQALINLAPLLVSAAQNIAAITQAVNRFLQVNSKLGQGPLGGGFENMNPEQLRALAAEYEGLEEELAAVKQEQAAVNANLERAQRLEEEGDLRGAAAADEQAEKFQRRLEAAQATLQAELELRQEQEQAKANALNLINATRTETEELERQAELQAMSAEERERERIALEAIAKRQEILNQLEASGFNITQDVLDNLDMRIQKYEAAAIAASPILNTMERTAGATGRVNNQIEDVRENVEETEKSLEEMLQDMIAASPALQKLGFDAESLQGVMSVVESSMENAFMSIVDGTKSAEDAFRAMAADIIKELYRVLVVQRLVGSFEKGGGGILGGLFSGFVSALGGGAGGGPGGGAGRASGGTVKAGQTYMTGESGRELFVPKTDGRILSPAQTNNAMSGAGNGVTVNQTINVSTGVAQTVRTEIKSLMPQIADSAKAAVADAKLRGGSYGRAF